MDSKLYVGNLPFKASEEDLMKLFSEAGQVQSVKIVMDAYSGRSRGFGFVEMASQEDSEKAITMFNGKPFMDRTLTVNKAKPQKSKGNRFTDRNR